MIRWTSTHERYLGSLYRQVDLGHGVDASRAWAGFHDGVLRVVVPLQEKQQATRIQVTSGSSSSRESG